MFKFASFLNAKQAFDGKSSSKTLFSVAASLTLAVALTVCDDKSSFKNSKGPENISLYLKPESKEILAKYLADRGIAGKEPQIVCFSRNASADHQYIYKPLYGQRAAFRLKGLVTTDTGVVVGVGRVSTMVGEVSDMDYVASMPFFDAKDGSKKQLNSSEVASLIDIPTRLEKAKVNLAGSLWKGRLPSAEVRSTAHSSLSGVTYTALPLNKQVVVEGYICSSNFADENGHCTYDRSLDPEEQQLLRDSAAAQATKTTAVASKPAPVAVPVDKEYVKSEDDVASEPAPKEECAVCRYMKAGPCRQQFIDWDTCVQGATEDDLHTKCFKLTCAMMKCMKNHEYYDIMSAGTDFTRLEAAEKDADDAAAKANQ